MTKYAGEHYSAYNIYSTKKKANFLRQNLDNLHQTSILSENFRYLCHALPAPSAGVHSLQRPCGANSHHQIKNTSLTIWTVCHPKLTITWSSMWLCILASDRLCSTNTVLVPAPDAQIASSCC